MADLDNFFAKKDRKKKTASKKFTTTEEVAKKLEDTAAKKSEKLKKDRAPDGDETNQQPQEQDEWKEFEEEKKDYTGLKIGNLTINPNQDSSVTNYPELGSGDLGEDGLEPGMESEKKSGPWKRIETQQQNEEEEAAAPPVVEKSQVSEPSSGLKAYKPPSMRNQSSAHQPAPLRIKGARNAAPDIHNEEFFPTLSGKKKTEGGAFEVVQHARASSYRQQMEPQGGPKLSLGNRYNTLSSNDS